MTLFSKTHIPATVLALHLVLAVGAATGEEPPMSGAAEATPAHATHRRHHEPPNAAEMTRHMQEDLGLSKDQAAKVRALNEEHVARMEKLRPSEEEMRARREEMEKIRSEHDAALQKILSPEQYATYRRSREDHAVRRQERHHGPHPE